ncbi:hypothetical protein [Nostoc sp.]|uniref:hypothetical protein n=1 Tax=Nostoc sp. TaxID=1180 RepID=UPI00359415BA
MNGTEGEMVVTLQLRQIDVQPGQYLTSREITWAEFEAILNEIGEHRAARVGYFQEVLEIRMPLPEHEINQASDRNSIAISYVS